MTERSEKCPPRRSVSTSSYRVLILSTNDITSVGFVKLKSSIIPGSRNLKSLPGSRSREQISEAGAAVSFRLPKSSKKGCRPVPASPAKNESSIVFRKTRLLSRDELDLLVVGRGVRRSGGAVSAHRDHFAVQVHELEVSVSNAHHLPLAGVVLLRLDDLIAL